MKNVGIPPGDIFTTLPPPRDRRENERVDLKIPLRILSYGFLMERSDAAICTDVSERGVSFETEAILNVGQVVTVEFHQKGEPYRCHARLTYRTGKRYGAYFLTAE